MPKLTVSQLVILSAAAQRDDRGVLPLPSTIRMNKGAAATVLKSLLKYGFVVEQSAKTMEAAWREEEGRRVGLAITDAGLAAINADAEASTSETRSLSTAPKVKLNKNKAPDRKSKAKSKAPKQRSGTKQDRLIGLLRRKEGASIREISKAIGWQAHSVRGAISGALKKKLRLKVTSGEVKERGRVYRIAGGR